MHPFDDAGPDLLLNLHFHATDQSLSLYLMDFDWRNSMHPRQQSNICYNLKGEVLNADWCGKIDTGVYSRFALTNQDIIQIRFNKHRSACVSVSGVFLDIPPLLPELAIEEKMIVKVKGEEKYTEKWKLTGHLPTETMDWYEQLRVCHGKKKLLLARKYDEKTDLLFTKEANILGLFMYMAAAETCYDSNRARLSFPKGDKLRSIVWTDDIIKLLDYFVMVNNGHNIWPFLIAEDVLNTVHTDMQKDKSMQRLFAISMVCQRDGLLAIPSACLHKMEELGISENEFIYKTLSRFIKQSQGKPIRNISVLLSQ